MYMQQDEVRRLEPSRHRHGLLGSKDLRYVDLELPLGATFPRKIRVHGDVSGTLVLLQGKEPYIIEQICQKSR